MISDDKTIDLIEAYLSGKLTGKDLDNFERRLREDKEFADEVAFHKKIITGIKATGEQKLKLQFSEMDKSLPEPAFLSIAIRRYWAVAAILVIGIAVCWYFFLNSKVNIQDKLVQKMVFSDTLKKKSSHDQIKNKGINNTVNDSSLENNNEGKYRLLAENMQLKYFKPFPNMITGGSRGDETDAADSLTLAMKYYDGKKYKESLNILSLLQKNTKHPNYEDVLFYAASCNLALSKYKKSQECFDLLRKNNLYKYDQQVDWFMVCVLLNTWKTAQAKQLIAKIIKEKGKYASKAQTLLDVMTKN